jgi:hypothetical protein
MSCNTPSTIRSSSAPVVAGRPGLKLGVLFGASMSKLAQALRAQLEIAALIGQPTKRREGLVPRLREEC